MFKDTIDAIINELIQLDIDAFHAYKQALQIIKEKDLHSNLKSFQEDHARHIKELSDLLKELGGDPIKPSQDFKGFIIEGMTFLRSITGTEGALKAMITNENITNEKYKKALGHKSLTESAKKLITANFNDEKRHLAYLEEYVEAFAT